MWIKIKDLARKAEGVFDDVLPEKNNLLFIRKTSGGYKKAKE